jgi:hypothetical protein
MDEIKKELTNRFSKALENFDFNKENNLLEMEFNSISENLFEYIKKIKEQHSVPLRKTTNDNICTSEFNLGSGKSNDVVLNDLQKNNLNHSKTSLNEQTTIPNNFSLTYEMKQFAKSKFIRNVEEVFENFKLYYQSKGILNSDWEAAWKKWVLNNNKYKNHLIKTTIDENMQLSQELLTIAKKYIKKELIELEFTKFKNHYISNGDLKVSWERVWENWCINSKQFNTQQPASSTLQEKQQYKWNFKKAQDTSNKIKDWLRFDKGINWLKDHYQKNIPIPGIGWQKVMHPDFNKEEILLYKIESENGQFLLNHKSNDIIDTEVLEND